MKLKPKMLGDELSLDEYNACQYLLYHMKCWKEEIRLNTETPYEGKYAKYTLQDTDFLMRGNNQTFKIIKDLNETSTLQLSLSNLTQLADKDHMTFLCNIYHQPIKTINNTKQYPPYIQEPKRKSRQESHEKPKIEDDFELINGITCELKDNTITIPLYDKIRDKPLFEQGELISEKLILQFHLFNTPYIDIANGRANDPEEILIDTETQLINCIKYAPVDGTQTIIRLNSNRDPYILPETLNIKTGQNIEIRGGTRLNAVLDGTVSKRTFIVNYGATLKLDHLTLQNNNCTGYGIYDRGRGGAILVEAIRNKNGVYQYGRLTCTNCTFTKNKAHNGGAIFSYHAGLYLDTCDFLDNYVTSNGGAVYYWAKDTRLNFPTLTGGRGKAVYLQVEVKDYRGNLVTEGEVDFYRKIISKNNKDDFTTEFIGTADVSAITDEENHRKKGWGIRLFNIPDDYNEDTMQLIAHYRAGVTFEDEVKEGLLNIIIPDEFTASFAKKYTAYPGEEISIRVNVKNSKNTYVKTINGKTIKGTFKINGVTKTASTSGTTYYVKYAVPSDMPIGTKIPVSFSLEENIYFNCDVINTNITVVKQNATGNTTKKQISGPVTGLFVLPHKIEEQGNNNYVDTSITDDLILGWKNAGITDLFVECPDYTIKKHKALLDTVIDKVKDEPIRVHAVIPCFYDMTVEGETEEDMVKKWGDVNPTVDSRKRWITTQVTTLATGKDTGKYISGICFDYLRFNGDTEKLKEYNGGVKVDERYTYINKFMDTLNQLITDLSKEQNNEWYTSVTLDPDNYITEIAATKYGQHFEYLNKKVDYVIPKCFSGNIVGGSDNWIVTKLTNMMTESKIDKSNILCSILTYNGDAELNNVKDDETKIKSVLLSKTRLDTTISAINKTNIAGHILYKEHYISEYPVPFNKAS